MHPRKELRIARSAAISFISNRLDGKGRLINLSSKGCAFRSDFRLEKEEPFVLRIHAPGEGEPIVIDQAVVRWHLSDQFGVEFLDVAERAQTRINVLLEE